MLCDKCRLVLFRRTQHAQQLLAGALVRPEPLFTTLPIVRNDRIGCAQYRIGRTVVLLQTNDLGLRKMTLKVQNVALVGSAPPVDGLVIISDRADVGASPRQHDHQMQLDSVGVLVFVYHQVLEALPIPLQNVRMTCP